MIWQPLARVLLPVYGGYTLAQQPSVAVIALIVVALGSLIAWELRGV